jgi:3-oxoacyl-[acyl-carrier-protein] synthase-3
MIGISGIAAYLPEQRIDALDRALCVGSSHEQVEGRIGFRSLAQMRPDQQAKDLAVSALEMLSRRMDLDPSAIEVLAVVSQNPGRNIPHLSAVVHGVLGLSDECACFDIGLGCSGYVYALSIVSAFMSANQLRKGVIVTADPYSRIVDPQDKATSLIFGDGSTATLLTDEPIFDLGAFSFGTLGAEAEKLACNDGILYMNGRAVFNFTASRVPDHIRKTVEKNQTDLDAIDCFVLHQGSRFIVETIADRLGVERRKVPFLAAEYGNTVSSSIPMMLESIMRDKNNNSLVLSGFGVGLSWASTVIKRRS